VDWATTVTTTGGVATTLIGVLAGSLLTSRANRMHWSRDKQIEACAAIVAESTRIQLALRPAWRHGDPLHWAYAAGARLGPAVADTEPAALRDIALGRPREPVTYEPAA